MFRYHKEQENVKNKHETLFGQNNCRVDTLLSEESSQKNNWAIIVISSRKILYLIFIPFVASPTD